MPGIYIHIPFCKSKCYYCDFYSIVLSRHNLHLKHDFLSALQSELIKRKDLLSGKRINTIYFGGGTPSLLSVSEINQVLDNIFSLFDTTEDVEITIEVNPDDFSLQFAKDLKENTPVNRLSIGVQSFIDKDLQVLGRRHDSKQAEKAVRIAQDVGFENISIDLIYGIPHSVDPFQSLEYNLEKFYALSLPHLSAYTLTIEPDTVFGKRLRAGRLVPVDEDIFARLFQMITESLEKHGYLHYEISNYAKEGFISRHNFSYWTGEPYLGIGPAAHSFDGDYRYWNKANLKTYIARLKEGQLPLEKEKLTDKDKFNEYILTHLRTYMGINTRLLEEKYTEFYKQVKDKIKEFEHEGFIRQTDNGDYVLTMKGKLIADNLIAELFV